MRQRNLFGIPLGVVAKMDKGWMVWSPQARSKTSARRFFGIENFETGAMRNPRADFWLTSRGGHTNLAFTS